MLTITKKLGLAALLASTLIGTASADVLDTFDYDTVLFGDSTDVGSPIVWNSVTDGGYVGGVTETSPAGDVEYTLNVNYGDAFDPAAGVTTKAISSSGALTYSEAPGVDGTLELFYTDYVGAPADGINLYDGAGAAGGFYFDVVKADHNLVLDLVVGDILGGISIRNFTLPTDISSPTRIFLSFASFIGNVDFTKVGFVKATINTDENSQLILTEVGTIPEPTTLAILGLGLLGFAASRKRKA